MYTFDKILVGLDTSYMDDQLIDAVCTICKISGSSDIYFMNIIRDAHLPESVLTEFPDLMDKAIQERKEAIESSVKSRFDCESVTPHFIVKEGQVTKEMMSFISENEIDLVVVGRKNEVKSGGITINRLARRAGTSLLVIPKDATLKMNRLLVPIDFSPYSKLALEKAIEFSRNVTQKMRIITQNVYSVPSGYHYTGKTYEEFADIMMDNAFRDFEMFTKDMDTDGVDLDSVYSLDKDEDIIKHIYKTAKKTKSDMIIIGAKGRSATTAIFIGSKAEKLIQMDTDHAVLIVRPKGKTAGFREYLSEL